MATVLVGDWSMNIIDLIMQKRVLKTIPTYQNVLRDTRIMKILDGFFFELNGQTRAKFRATVVITVMAQTMDERILAIWIASFCSNNRFTADDVKHRANFIEAELNKLGIQMLTYSAEGDSREMKMMRQVLRLGSLPPRLSRKKGTICTNKKLFQEK
jgi:DNA polymerase III delta prime subunit